MAKVSAGDIRNGVKQSKLRRKVCQVIDFMHVKPGKGAASVRAKMKNIIDGGVVETTFRPTETFEQAHIERERKCSICITMVSSTTTWTMRHLNRS